MEIGAASLQVQEAKEIRRMPSVQGTYEGMGSTLQAKTTKTPCDDAASMPSWELETHVARTNV